MARALLPDRDSLQGGPSEVVLGVLVVRTLVPDHLDRLLLEIPDHFARHVEVARKGAVRLEDRIAQCVSQLSVSLGSRGVALALPSVQGADVLLALVERDRVGSSFIVAAAEHDERAVSPAGLEFGEHLGPGHTCLLSQPRHSNPFLSVEGSAGCGTVPRPTARA